MKKMVSGIKPSGKPHLGNYLGAILNFIKYQDQYEMYIFIADLHAITVDFDSEQLREHTKNLIALYLAAGLDPKRVCLFKQSDVAAHSQLGYLMLCHSSMGELNRMTQFKDKCQKIKDDKIPTGLFIYPGLMAADIVLYDANYVPVGEDQKQHIELTRDISQRMNNKYGDIFTVPEPVIAKNGARIMSLQEPTNKMSKSDDIRKDKGCIYLLDDLEKIRKKIMSAVTDTENEVYYDQTNKAGVSNLMTILHSISNLELQEIEDKYRHSGYKVFKTAVADCVCEHIEKLQKRYFDILESQIIDQILFDGAKKANKIANKKIERIHKAIGFN